jgi:hypothetical protein
VVYNGYKSAKSWELIAPIEPLTLIATTQNRNPKKRISSYIQQNTIHNTYFN